MKKIQEKGITLIALVITIVILLILAGVTLSIVMNDGLLEKSQNVVDKYSYEQEKESVSLAVISSMIGNTSSLKITKDNLENSIKKQFGDNKDFTIKGNADGSFLIEFNDTNRKYYIENTGKITENEDIIKITTLDELKAFRDEVNSGNDFEGKVVYLANDIEINEEWNPIGGCFFDDSNIRARFSGIFDGCGYTIDNMSLTSSNYDYLGFFGYVREGTIKNLNIGENCNISGNAIKMAAVVASLSSNSTVINCSNNSDIINSKANSEVGGIVGTSNGLANGTNNIINCYNTGDITGNFIVGGIIGNAMNGKMANCYNIGKIEGETYCGGISGWIADKHEINNCYNIGNIISNKNFGGIFGGNTSDAIYTFKNNYYLENIVNSSNDTTIIKGIEVKTMPELKKLTSTLGDSYKDDTNDINDGYPILFWQ